MKELDKAIGGIADMYSRAGLAVLIIGVIAIMFAAPLYLSIPLAVFLGISFYGRFFCK